MFLSPSFDIKILSGQSMMSKSSFKSFTVTIIVQSMNPSRVLSVKWHNFWWQHRLVLQFLMAFILLNWPLPEKRIIMTISKLFHTFFWGKGVCILQERSLKTWFCPSPLIWGIKPSCPNFSGSHNIWPPFSTLLSIYMSRMMIPFFVVEICQQWNWRGKVHACIWRSFFAWGEICWFVKAGVCLCSFIYLRE